MVLSVRLRWLYHYPKSDLKGQTERSLSVLFKPVVNSEVIRIVLWNDQYSRVCLANSNLHFLAWTVKRKMTEAFN
jgi:hypothetical protein